MSVFGTSELAIVKQTPRFGERRYVCDVEKMIRAIGQGAEEMFAETMRYPCTLHVHPTDYWHLVTDRRFCFNHTDGGGWFMTMRVFKNPGAVEGVANLSICPGCQTFLGTCANTSLL